MTGLSNSRDKELEKRLPMFIAASALEMFNRKLARLRRKRRPA
jgi:hypothetical protein